MDHLIRSILVVVIFITVFSITSPIKLIFCIWDWEWKFDNYLEAICDIAVDVVDFDS